MRTALAILLSLPLLPSAWAGTTESETVSADEAAPEPAAPAPSASTTGDVAFEDDYDDLVIVWPDQFARWRDTRWLIATEVVIPMGMVFGMTNNKEFRTFAWQVKGVVSCDQEHKNSRRAIEVLCQIEDFAIQSTSYDRFTRERDKQLVQEVLDDIDRKMTQASIELQVNRRGAVTNIGMRGLDRRNIRDAVINETLRQIIARMFYPFHMKLPKNGVQEGVWPEFDSELMSMPSVDGIQGSSQISHWMNFYKGYLLVQDVGEGIVELSWPTVQELGPNSLNDSERDGDASPTLASGLGIPDGAFDEGGLRWKLGLNGVAIYNIDNGIMEERVWTMTGVPTATNPSLMEYWYSGRIQLLGDDDAPELGPSRQISYPGLEIEGLPVWLPADPEIAKDLQDFHPRAKMRVKNRSGKKKKK
jgi:hypothetical protein